MNDLESRSIVDENSSLVRVEDNSGGYLDVETNIPEMIEALNAAKQRFNNNAESIARNSNLPVHTEFDLDIRESLADAAAMFMPMSPDDLYSDASQAYPNRKDGQDRLLIDISNSKSLAETLDNVSSSIGGLGNISAEEQVNILARAATGEKYLDLSEALKESRAFADSQFRKGTEARKSQLEGFVENPQTLPEGMPLDNAKAYLRDFNKATNDPLTRTGFDAYGKPSIDRDSAKISIYADVGLAALEVTGLKGISNFSIRDSLDMLALSSTRRGYAAQRGHVSLAGVPNKTHVPSGINAAKFDGLVNEVAEFRSARGFGKWKQSLVDEGVTPTQIQEAVYQGSLKRGDNLWKGDWKRYYEEISGTTFPGKPSHAHHLVEKGSSSPAAIANRQILEDVGINPLLSRDNLAWAPNVTGQHGAIPQGQLLELLTPVKGSRDGVVNVLRQWSEIAKARQ